MADVHPKRSNLKSVMGFLSLGLYRSKGTSDEERSPHCHICTQSLALHRCQSCGKPMCTLHTVKRGANTDESTATRVCETCDRNGTQIVTRRRLENEVQELNEAIQSTLPILETEVQKSHEITISFRRIEEEFRTKTTAFDTLKSDTMGKLESILARRKEITAHISSLQAEIAAAREEEKRNEAETMDSDRVSESAEKTLKTELIRRTELHAQMQDFQSQLRHSVSTTLIREKCCNRCKSVTQLAFKERELDLFPSRLQAADSSLNMTPHPAVPAKSSNCLFS